MRIGPPMPPTWAYVAAAITMLALVAGVVLAVLLCSPASPLDPPRPSSSARTSANIWLTDGSRDREGFESEAVCVASVSETQTATAPQAP